jgi:hypothetical protein
MQGGKCGFSFFNVLFPAKSKNEILVLWNSLGQTTNWKLQFTIALLYVSPEKSSFWAGFVTGVWEVL